MQFKAGDIVEPRIPQAFATRGLVVSNTVKIRAGAKVQDIYWFNDGETTCLLLTEGKVGYNRGFDGQDWHLAGRDTQTQEDRRGSKCIITEI